MGTSTVFEEGLPPRFPCCELTHPRGSLIVSLDLSEHRVDREKFLVRRQIRSPCEVPVSALADMEVTALDTRRWPQPPDRRYQGPVAVNDGDDGGRDPFDERRP